MQNSYIIDVFLAAVSWMMLAYLYFDAKARIAELDNVMTANTLAVALSRSIKAAIIFAVPLSCLYVFLLWRFYAVMVVSKSWGYGGAGLLVIMSCVGLPILWLHIMLVCVKHSKFNDFAVAKKELDSEKKDLNEGW